MSVITVELDEGSKSINVENGTRLVLALEDAGIDISHRCGGNAKCTTCRCSISEGEPSKMTQAEKGLLEKKGLSGVRLSCQIAVEGDMTVKPLNRVKDMDWDQPGSRPADSIAPEPVWIVK